MTSKVDLDTSDSSQDHTRKEVPSPTGQQEKRPSSKQPKPKCPAIYNEMEKDQLFKKADPNQREGEGASQRKSSHDKHKDKPAQLVARGRHQIGASSSSWEGQTKTRSTQSSAEGDTRGRERVRPISPPSRKTSADQVWTSYKARDVKSPPSRAVSRATSYPPPEPTPDDEVDWQEEGDKI